MKLFKSRFNAYKWILLGGLFIFRGAFCDEITSSVWSGVGAGAHGENGALIVGVNPKSKMLSGYYETNNITGSATAECRFFFTGKLTSENTLSIQIVTAHPDFVRDKLQIVNGTVAIQPKPTRTTLTVFPNHIPESCDWLYNGLPSYVSPKDFALKNGLTNELVRKGDWHAVNVIRSKRSYFHAQSNEASKEKAFVVAGDLIYIYDEIPDWYYAKFQSDRGKETSGWIKKTDTIQLSNLK